MFSSTISKTITAIVIAIGFVSGADSAKASTYDHLDQLALQLQGQSRRLISEFRLHYRHTREYRHLISDGYEMYRLAAHIHRVAHQHGGVHHLQSDLKQLDQLHHHIHDLVDHREVHPHGGHVHGNTGHVHAMLEEMEDTLHHMLDDVKQLTRPVYHHRDHRHDTFHGGPDREIRIGNSTFVVRFPW